MDNIPTEGFSRIISFLPLQDQLVGITVSKKWSDLIITYNLYTRLEFNGRKKLDAALSYFNEGREYIAKILQSLTMKYSQLDDPQKVLLLLHLFQT